MTPQRDEYGRFAPRNAYASIGGRARAERLTPAQRAEIAAKGFDALAVMYFNGDRRRAKEWLVRHGTWAGLFGTESAREHWPLPDPDPVSFYMVLSEPAEC